MSKRSTSQNVLKDMQARFDEIVQQMDTFCQVTLNEEYTLLCRELTATLCRKRPSPLVPGKASRCGHSGIIYALGMVNFLLDSPLRCKPDLRIIRSEFEYDAGEIQADLRPVGHVSHVSRLADPLDG